MNREREKDSNEGLSADELDNGSQSESETESDSSSDSSDSSDSDYECTVCNKKFSGAVPLRQHQKGSKHKKVLARKKKERKLSNKDGEEEEDGDGQIVPEPYGVCKTCDKEFSGLEPYRMHLKSKAHKQRVLHNSILEEAKEEGGEINVDKLRGLYLGKKAAATRKPSDVPEDGAPNRLASSSKAAEDYLEEHDRESYECKDCGKTFGGLVPFAQHLTSKTHAKQVQKRSLLGKITSEDGSVPQSDASALTVEDGVLVCKVCSASFSGPESGLDHLKGQNHAKKHEKYLKKLEKRKMKAGQPKEPGSDLTGSEGVEAPEGIGDEPPSTFPYKSTPV